MCGSIRAVVVLTLLVLAAGCSTARPDVNGAASIPGGSVPPKIVQAWFGPIAWDAAANRYTTTLHVVYPPTEGPLYLEWITAWTLWDSSSGVSRSWGKEDISHLTKLATSGQHFVKPFTYTYRGEYTLTVRLRNPAGTDEIKLPTLKVP